MDSKRKFEEFKNPLHHSPPTSIIKEMFKDLKVHRPCHDRIESSTPDFSPHVLKNDSPPTSIIKEMFKDLKDPRPRHDRIESSSPDFSPHVLKNNSTDVGSRARQSTSEKPKKPRIYCTAWLPSGDPDGGEQFEAWSESDNDSMFDSASDFDDEQDEKISEIPFGNGDYSDEDDGFLTLPTQKADGRVVYYIWVDFVCKQNKNRCFDMLREIDCEEHFVCFSTSEANLFSVRLRKKEALKLISKEGVLNVIRRDKFLEGKLVEV